mgnify:CR=1 FL=1
MTEQFEPAETDGTLDEAVVDAADESAEETVEVADDAVDAEETVEADDTAEVEDAEGGPENETRRGADFPLHRSACAKWLYDWKRAHPYISQRRLDGCFETAPLRLAELVERS